MLCPECETNLDVVEDEVDEGEIISCPECGTDFEVVTSNPLELKAVEEGYEEEEEEESEDGDYSLGPGAICVRQVCPLPWCSVPLSARETPLAGRSEAIKTKPALRS